MNNSPLDKSLVDEKIKQLRIPDVGKASIREIVALVNLVEEASNFKYVRMELGVPGLPPAKVGVEAEKAALDRGVAAIYPMVDGIKPLKKEASKFIKNFLNIDLAPAGCIPTTGSMQGTYVAFLAAGNVDKKKDTTLFIDPGFPVQKRQHLVLGRKYQSFDVYNYRGDKLREKLESYFKTGKIHSVLYSNPNNPSWICFTEDELKTIGELATKYDVVVMEDLAYFGMDFRKDYSVPGKAPYQPTVAHYTDNYILFISSSKVFSYAGERIGMMVISNKLFNTRFEDLLEFYPSSQFGYAMVFGTLYPLSSGTSHSAQYALAAMLKAANTGDFNIVESVLKYGDKAKIMKKLFTDNGFEIVYDTDIDEPIADGFYFTFSYPGMDAEQLLNELVYYGISAISLLITGSERLEGIRACTSLVQPSQFGDLEDRLKQFHNDH